MTHPVVQTLTLDNIINMMSCTETSRQRASPSKRGVFSFKHVLNTSHTVLRSTVVAEVGERRMSSLKLMCGTEADCIDSN